MWDSGLIEGARPEMRYAGPALSPRTRYSWRVRTVSAEGFESPFSEEQVFEQHTRVEKCLWVEQALDLAHDLVQFVAVLPADERGHDPTGPVLGL
jgi:hypothetical protein